MSETPHDNSVSDSSRTSGAHATVSLRSQAAFLRTLLDELERVSPAVAEGALGAQVVEELARLGYLCLETANAMSAVVPANVQSPADFRAARCG